MTTTSSALPKSTLIGDKSQKENNPTTYSEDGGEQNTLKNHGSKPLTEKNGSKEEPSVSQQITSRAICMTKAKMKQKWDDGHG